MRGRLSRRTNLISNFIPAGDVIFLQLVLLYPLLVSQILRDFFISAIDFCLQDSV